MLVKYHGLWMIARATARVRPRMRSLQADYGDERGRGHRVEGGGKPRPY